MRLLARLVRAFTPRPSRPPPQLPDELLIEIFDCVDGHERAATLLSLCVASRRFHPLAERVLYCRPSATIRVGVYAEHVERGLLLAPSFVPLIVSLRLTVETPLCKPPPAFLPLRVPPVPVLPNLRTLALVFPRELYWCDASVMLALLRSVGPSCPRLVELDLRLAEFSDSSSSHRPPLAPLTAQRCSKCFPISAGYSSALVGAPSCCRCSWGLNFSSVAMDTSPLLSGRGILERVLCYLSPARFCRDHANSWAIPSVLLPLRSPSACLAMLLSSREIWLILACIALSHLYLHRLAIRRACARLSRSSQSRPPAHRLPNELFTEVFLALDGHKPTLVALSLCSRHMRALAEPVLFRTLAATIHVGMWKHSLERSPVLAMLAQTPRPLAHVTAVELALASKYPFHPCSHPLLLPPLPVFPNARALALFYSPHNTWCTRARWSELFTARSGRPSLASSSSTCGAPASPATSCCPRTCPRPSRWKRIARGSPR